MAQLAKRTKKLSDDDFRRLGVRPAECRSAVIRVAAQRQAEVIAKQQLESPSATGQQQLFQLTTSAYRLLDPRQRTEKSQRVVVGRILPLTLMAAGTTQFLRRPFHELPDRPTADDGEPAMRVMLDESDRPEPQQEFPVIILDSDRWKDSLLFTDLLLPPGAKVGDQPHLRWVHHPAVIGALTAATVLAAIGLAVWLQDHEERAVPPLGLRSGSVSASSSESLVETGDPDGNAPTAGAPSSGVDSINQQPATWQDPVQQEATHEEASQDQPVQQQAAQSAHLADPFAARRPTSSSVTKAATAGEASAGITTVADAAATDPSASVQNSDPEAARVALLAELPELSAPWSEPRIADLVDQLDTRALRFPAGCADWYATRLVALERSWITHPFPIVEQRAELLGDHFEADTLDLLTESFQIACQRVPTMESRRRLLGHGWWLVERLVFHERVDRVEQVLPLINTSAQLVNHQDSLRLIDEYERAIERLVRFAPAVEQAEQLTLDLCSPTEAAIVGRYRCFLLRQWDNGMPWLANSSNPAIARFARQELKQTAQLADSSDAVSVDKRVELATSWAGLATGFAGREAASLRLHALDLLHQTRDKASALDRLKIDELIDDVAASLNRVALNLGRRLREQAVSASLGADDPQWRQVAIQR